MTASNDDQRQVIEERVSLNFGGTPMDAGELRMVTHQPAQHIGPDFGWYDPYLVS